MVVMTMTMMMTIKIMMVAVVVILVMKISKLKQLVNLNKLYVFCLFEGTI